MAFSAGHIKKFWKDKTQTCIVFRCLYRKFDDETWNVWFWNDWDQWHHWEWV